jgi:hypothetical protein
MEDRSYVLGKVQGFFEAFACFNDTGNDGARGDIYTLPEAATLEAACWAFVRSKCPANWQQSLHELALTPASENWRELLAAELVGEELRGGYLFQIFSYQADATERQRISRELLRMLEELFAGEPLRVWHLSWKNLSGQRVSPWTFLFDSEWVFETKTGSYLLTLVYWD